MNYIITIETEAGQLPATVTDQETVLLYVKQALSMTAGDTSAVITIKRQEERAIEEKTNGTKNQD